MRGFQLWINLPASEKMKPAAYRDIPAAEIPTVALGGGGEVRVIAGDFAQEGARDRGADPGPQHAAAVFRRAAAASGDSDGADTGAATTRSCTSTKATAVVGEDDARPLPYRAAGLLTPGESVRVRAGARACGLLLLVRQADRRAGRAVRAVRHEHAARKSSRRSSTTSAVSSRWLADGQPAPPDATCGRRR